VREIPATDWMRLSWIGDLTQLTIWYPNFGAIPIVELSFHDGDIPSTELSPRWGHIPSSEYERNPVEENYQGFIHL